MATSLKRKELFSRLKPLLSSQRFGHSMVKDRDEIPEFQEGIFKKSNWKTMDSRSLGINKSMISSPAFIVLKILQSTGHEAYLVGGCVRDLLLKKTPKDFDVITTAALKQVRKQFHRSQIVGRKFPICMVHVKGSVIEVSSFQTVAKRDKERENLLASQTPNCCDKSDLARWRNSMHRDFTVNSLFFDPFVHKVYDYANAMKDILNLKLRTLLPAQLSFTEDSARILRGLRIAARLGLSLTNETETAIYKLASSISKLDKSRISMELNYMLSYGAAEPSLRLLQRFHLLDLLLPFHAAYLSQQVTMPGPIMLMRLFFHLDQLVSCDRPSDSNLWIGLLAFHLALVNNPQHPHVVATFASVLYHRKWKEGVEFARPYSQAPVIFVPEMWNCSINSDDELAERVKKFSLLVKDSVDAFSEKESLFKAMSTFPDFPCSGLVFVSPNKRKSVRHLFDIPTDEDLKSEGRKNFKIDLDLLKHGDVGETRLALGKIILDTMSYGVRQGNHAGSKDDDRKHTLRLSDSKSQQESAMKHNFIRKTSNFSDHGAKMKQYKGLKRNREEMVATDRNLTETDNKSHDNVTTKWDPVAISLIEKKKRQKVAMEHDEVASKDYKSTSNGNASKNHEDLTTSSPKESLITLMKEVFENEKHGKTTESSKEIPVDIKGGFCPHNVATQNQQTSTRRSDPPQDNIIRKEECESNPSKVMIKAKEENHQKKDVRPSLSSLFK